MENLTQNAAPTFESVWLMLQENARIQRENERILNEKFAETDRLMQETSRKMQETDRRMQETDRQIRNMRKDMGSWAHNHGTFAEEYFFNSFENNQQNFFGEKFDVIKKNVKSVLNGLEDEYDIVMYNCASIAIIEVKFKAHEDHIAKLLKKTETFKILFPYYKDYNIYIALAAMSFHEGVEGRCISEGIAVIKQVGDTVMISDEHLKVF